MPTQRAVFFAPDLCRLGGIKPTTLRTWRSRGLIAVDKDHDREWTRYDRSTALRVLVLAALVQAGLEPKVAARYASGIAERPSAQSITVGAVTITVNVAAFAAALGGL